MRLNLWADLSSSDFLRSALLLTSIALARFSIGRYCYNYLDGEVMAIRAVARFGAHALLLFSFSSAFCLHALLLDSSSVVF